MDLMSAIFLIKKKKNSEKNSIMGHLGCRRGLSVSSEVDEDRLYSIANDECVYTRTFQIFARRAIAV